MYVCMAATTINVVNSFSSIFPRYLLVLYQCIQIFVRSILVSVYTDTERPLLLLHIRFDQDGKKIPEEEKLVWLK